MKITTTSIAAAAAAAVTLSVLPAVAQAGDSPVSANIALTTKYKYRGQDQSDDQKNVLPAVQGGFDFAMNGFYAGNWNSSVGFGNGTEMDFYAGYKGELEGFSYDVGVLHYYYPAVGDINTTEAYVSVGFGPLTAKYSHTVSKKYFGLDGGRGTGYLELNAEYEVAKGITLVGHVGSTRFTSKGKGNGGVNYTDYKVGADFDIGSGFTAGIAYVGANKKGTYGDLNKARVIATLSKAL
jgi:uncharacterized protein (TIGR02001 family)